MNYVYFIRAKGGFGPVKIGYSRVPQTRLETLSTWAPYPLEIVATIPGGLELEVRFHKAFEEHHSHREWFHPCAVIERTIEQIRSGMFEVDALPVGKRLRTLSRGSWSETQRRALSLSALIRHRSEAHGLFVPGEWRAALNRFSLLSDEGREDLSRMILAHIEDPLIAGHSYESARGKKALQAYLETRGAA